MRIHDFLNPPIVIEQRIKKQVEYKYLHFIPFAELTRWDYNSYFKEKSIKSQYEIVELREILRQSNQYENLQNDTEYNLLGVRSYGGGCFFREQKLGKDIQAKKLNKVSNNQFIYSRLGAGLGGFDIVNQEFDGFYVSNEFPTFDIDCNRLYPEFLRLIFVMPYYWNKIAKNLTGSALKRYNEQKLLSLHLPLPPLSVQKALVQVYTAKTTEAKQKEELATELEKSIEEYLTTELGIEVQKKEVVESKYKYLRFVGFDSLERWDLWNEPKEIVKYKYPCEKFENILTISSGNFLPKSSQLEGEYMIYGGNGYNGKHNEYCFESKRILIGRVGEYCGNVHLVDGKYWVTDNAFYSNLINTNFTLEYLEIVLRFANLNQFRVLSAQPSISQKNIANVQLPLPPLAVQNRIATHITHLKEQIKALRLEAKTLQAEAKQEFETAVFE